MNFKAKSTKTEVSGLGIKTGAYIKTFIFLKCHFPIIY